MSLLFTPITIRGETIPNRVFVSPMCQYSSDTEDGRPGIWHTIHYGTRAVGGAGLVMVEATGVQAEGRISPRDLGIWSDAHVDSYRPIVDAINSRGATPAIQLAHAGRKASHDTPWAGGATLGLDQGGWEVMAPSPIRFQDNYAEPNELSIEDIDGVVADFASAARRSSSSPASQLYRLSPGPGRRGEDAVRTSMVEAGAGCRALLSDCMVGTS